MKESEIRARKAKSMLNDGVAPFQAARECGYRSVQGMMGAISFLGLSEVSTDSEKPTERVDKPVDETPKPREVIYPFKSADDSARASLPQLTIDYFGTDSFDFKYCHEKDSLRMQRKGCSFWLDVPAGFVRELYAGIGYMLDRYQIDKERKRQ